MFVDPDLDNVLMERPYLLKYMHNSIRRSKRLALIAVEHDGLVLEYVHDDLRHDRDVVLAAVKNNGNALKFAPECMRDDPDIVFAAASSSLYALEHASARLRNEWRFLYKVTTISRAADRDDYVGQLVDDLVHEQHQMSLDD